MFESWGYAQPRGDDSYPEFEYVYGDSTQREQSHWTPGAVANLLTFATGCTAALIWIFTGVARAAVVWGLCWILAFVLAATKAARKTNV